MQDEIPVLAVAAAFAEGVTEIRDAAELRVKESDRIATVEQLLARLGVGVESASDALVDPRRPSAAGPGRQLRRPSHRDGGGGRGERRGRASRWCEEWRAVAVSYPEFTDDLMTVTGRS